MLRLKCKHDICATISNIFSTSTTVHINEYTTEIVGRYHIIEDREKLVCGKPGIDSRDRSLIKPVVVMSTA